VERECSWRKHKKSVVPRDQFRRSRKVSRKCGTSCRATAFGGDRRPRVSCCAGLVPTRAMAPEPRAVGVVDRHLTVPDRAGHSAAAKVSVVVAEPATAPATTLLSPTTR